MRALEYCMGGVLAMGLAVLASGWPPAIWLCVPVLVLMLARSMWCMRDLAEPCSGPPAELPRVAPKPVSRPTLIDWKTNPMFRDVAA